MFTKKKEYTTKYSWKDKIIIINIYFFIKLINLRLSFDYYKCKENEIQKTK